MEQVQLDFEKAFYKENKNKMIALEAKHSEYKKLLESEDFGRLDQRDYVLWEIDFPDVFIKGGFDIIIGNPPYVRREEIGPPTIVDRPTTREERKAYKEKLIRAVQAYAGRQLKVDKKSDLYVYFYHLGMSLLNKKGIFVFITSNAWLDVGYGAGLQDWLLRNMDIVDIYDNQAKRSFRSADVNTVIVVFNKPEEKPLFHTARFTAFKKPFQEMLSSENLLAIEAAKGIVSTDGFRVYQALQQDLLEEGFEKDESQKKLGETVHLKGQYKGNKWGGKYLRAPDIYFRILEKGGDKLVRLGDIAEVRRGFTTGCNQFFYLDDAKIKEWGIEDEFLVPVIKSPRECQTIIIDPNVLPNKLFMCHKTKKELKNTNALEYIQWGESQGFHKRPSTSSRPRWWDVGERREPEIIIPCSYGEIFKIFLNKGVFIDKRLYECCTVQPIIIAALLNSSLTFFFAEIASRTGLGEGLLDLTVYEVADWLVVDPKVFSESKTIEIEKTFEKIWRRDIQPIDKEAENQDRNLLDELILQSIDLDKPEIQEIYYEVIRMVSNRLDCADTF